MINPFGDQPVPGSYDDLQARLYKKVSAKVNDQIARVLQKAYEDALNEENLVLSRAERNRLFAQTTQKVLEDILKKPGKNSSAD